MSQDVAARLSALSQDHREGRLTTRAYRGLRAPLLDMLVTVEPLTVPEQVDPSTTTRPRQRPPAASAAGSAAAAVGATGAAGEGGAAGAVVASGAAPRSEEMGLLAPADSLAEASALARTNLHTATQAEPGYRLRPMVAGSVLLGATVVLVAAWMAWSPPEPAQPAVGTASPALDVKPDAPLPAPHRTLTPMPPPLPSEPKRKSVAPPPATAAVVSGDSPSCDPQAGPAKAAKGVKAASAPSAGTGASTPSVASATGATGAAAPCRDRLSPTEFGPRMLLLPGAATNGVVFAISARPVSQAQFRLFCQRTARPYPRQPWSEDDDPVVNITWHEARDYLAWLSSTTGKRYRLPTETEWLYFANQLKVDTRLRNGNVREWLRDTPDDSLTSTANALGAADAAGAPGPFDGASVADATDAIDGASAADGPGTVDGFGTSNAPGAARTSSNTVRSRDHLRLVRGVSYADPVTDLLSARRSRDASMRDAVTGFRALREIH